MKWYFHNQQYCLLVLAHFCSDKEKQYFGGWVLPLHKLDLDGVQLMQSLLYTCTCVQNLDCEKSF